jgi:phosphoglycolate phosphatase
LNSPSAEDGVVCAFWQDIRVFALLLLQWKLNRNNSFMVGDSESDVEAAQKNGIKSIAVLYGYGNTELIIKSKPDYLIEKIADLLNLINTII